MAKICDNKSVGMVVRRDDGGLIRFLMIDRGNYPRCKALPAGHCDGGSYAEMAATETQQEAGLQIVMRDMFMVYEGTIDNPCKREGGSSHAWRIYFCHGCSLPNFDLKPGDDAKAAFWATISELFHYAIRTEYFFSKLGLTLRDVGTLTLKVFGHPKNGGPLTDEEKALYEEWMRDPGLEPVWYYMLRMAGFFPWTFQDAPTRSHEGLALALGDASEEDARDLSSPPGSD